LTSQLTFDSNGDLVENLDENADDRLHSEITEPPAQRRKIDLDLTDPVESDDSATLSSSQSRKVKKFRVGDWVHRDANSTVTQTGQPRKHLTAPYSAHSVIQPTQQTALLSTHSQPTNPLRQRTQSIFLGDWGIQFTTYE
jgi:hypothetical protein